jgi:hypothetical protein
MGRTTISFVNLSVLCGERALRVFNRERWRGSKQFEPALNRVMRKAIDRGVWVPAVTRSTPLGQFDQIRADQCKSVAKRI